MFLDTDNLSIYIPASGGMYIDAWYADRKYTAGYDFVMHVDSRVYRCLVSHTSSSVNAPGIGSQWQLYWYLLGAFMSIDDQNGLYGNGYPSASKHVVLDDDPRLNPSISSLADSSTITPNFSINDNFIVTLSGNRTLANPTNMTVGQSGVIIIIQDSVGGRTLTFGSYYKFSGGVVPTLTTSGNAVDMLRYIVRSSSFIICEFISDIK